MLKRLRIYYFYIALPFVALLSGAAFYFDLIAKTITSNPHPQINYAIFAIILLGGGLILQGVQRQMNEARALSKYSEAVRSGMPNAELQQMAINLDVDIAYVLRMLAASAGRRINHQEQIAIEHELDKARGRLSSRMALPQFLSGLLVGMGLLGTFVGLLATLNDISALISSFSDIDMTTANPIDVFRTMIDRMKAPMQSMGIAFSASMFGLLGSIVLGLMMVGVRRFLGDLLSLLGSEVAQHIEFALANDGFVYSKTALKQGAGRPDSANASVDMLARVAVQAIGSKAVGAEQGAVPAGLPAESRVSENAAADQRTNDRSVARSGDSGRGIVSEADDESLRVLMRIEDRLAETARMQLRSLNTEIDDFQKQRGDMLRSIAEHTEAVGNFRNELQRVGRQLGSILSVMEKGNGELMVQLSELMVRMSDDATETHRLLRAQIDALSEPGGQ